jgi:hypothetical protein
MPVNPPEPVTGCLKLVLSAPDTIVIRELMIAPRAEFILARVD